MGNFDKDARGGLNVVVNARDRFERLARRFAKGPQSVLAGEER
jgi:hypothetical protein